MKTAWTVLLISAITDFIITAGTAWNVLPSDMPATSRQITTIVIGGLVAFARTVQQALKATPETSAALKGDQSSVTTVVNERTP